VSQNTDFNTLPLNSYAQLMNSRLLDPIVYPITNGILNQPIHQFYTFIIGWIGQIYTWIYWMIWLEAK